MSRKLHKHLIEIGKIKERKEIEKPVFKRRGTRSVNNLLRANFLRSHKQPKKI